MKEKNKEKNKGRHSPFIYHELSFYSLRQISGCNQDFIFGLDAVQFLIFIPKLPRSPISPHLLFNALCGFVAEMGALSGAQSKKGLTSSSLGMDYLKENHVAQEETP